MPFVLVDYLRPGVALITPNWLKRMSSIAFDVVVPFKSELEKVTYDNSVRVVVLTGVRQKLFVGCRSQVRGSGAAR